MIVTRTPFRVSLFGGGTDYPSFYENHEYGAVLGFALKHYCYLQVRRLPPFFSHRHRIVYSRIELVSAAAQIEHPTVRAVLTELSDLIGDDGLEIHHHGDLPARSGLGSSSSFVVGLLNAVYSLYGRVVYPPQLAAEASRIERDVVGDTVGDQDQTIAAHGGLASVRFRADGISVSRPPVTNARTRQLIDHLILVFTGATRIASSIALSQTLRIEENMASLLEMRDLAEQAEAVLRCDQRDIRDIGSMLHRSWELKRGLSSLVSTGSIDALYAAARGAGAIGGKVLGAGGGGFMVFFAEPERRGEVLRALRAAMPSLVGVPVDIDQYGTRVVLREPNGFGTGSGIAP